MIGPSIIKNHLSLKTIVDMYSNVLSYSDIKPFMTKGDLLAIAASRNKKMIKEMMELIVSEPTINFIVIDSISDSHDYFIRLGMGLIPKGLTLSDFQAQRAYTRQPLGKPSS